MIRSKPDPEITTIRRIFDMLGEFDGPAQSRIVDFVAARVASGPVARRVAPAEAPAGPALPGLEDAGTPLPMRPRRQRVAQDEAMPT